MSTSATPAQALGEAFVAALVDGDADAVAASLAPNARLSALLPGGIREELGRTAVAGAFADWFVRYSTARELLESDVDVIAGQLSVRYRMHTSTGGRASVIEQHLYATVDDPGLGDIRLMCTGFHPR
ncbi:MAG: nuclear transport factor 2 family protein [Pseudonocardia sp.]|nr:nuclear transport factor 2 family protein [Pseudonocardia sp.]